MSESERLSAEDLAAESATALPRKEVMSLLDLNADVDLALDLAAPVDLAVAADVAAHESGVEVEVLSADGAPGRLARLRRRLPLVGRGAPEGPTDPAELDPDAVEPTR